MRHRVYILGILSLLIIMTMLAIPSNGFGDVPQQINYQGYLTDDLGSPQDNSYGMVFAIYDVSSGGAALWSESQTVTVVSGIYNVKIGQDPGGNPFPTDLFDGQRWLGVTVGADTEMTPRQFLTSVPYAMRAGEADSVADGTIVGQMLAPGAVNTDAVADGAITAAKVDGGADSGLDADLLDGHSSEDFLEVTGGTVDGLLTLEGTIGPQLVIHDSGISNERPGLQFTGNNIHFIAGDDLSDEYFGFYSGYGSTRTFNAKLRVHGKATDNWGRYICLTHDGTDGTIETDSGDLVLDPEDDVRLAAGKGVVFPDGSRQTTAYVTSLENRVASLESEVSALKALLLNVTRTGSDIHFSGVNLHVDNGTGSTNGAVNGLGNLIVGYNEPRTGDNVRTGSHNIVVGRQHNYSSFGGLVAGETNTVSDAYASVTGGKENTASGLYSNVSGGRFNHAFGSHTTIAGGGGDLSGDGNQAHGQYSVILGGRNNSTGEHGSMTLGLHATISGGAGSDAKGTGASVSGGYINHADGSHASISGGRYSTASGDYASVSGGANGTASGDESSVSGGHENSAVGRYSSVTGGYQNSADAWWSTVSGGYDRHVAGQFDWQGGEYFSQQ